MRRIRRGVNLLKLRQDRVVYVVFADFDVDGGFGDAIATKEPIVVFSNKYEADEYVRENNEPHTYDSPWDDLKEGGCHVEEVPLEGRKLLQNGRR